MVDNYKLKTIDILIYEIIKCNIFLDKFIIVYFKLFYCNFSFLSSTILNPKPQTLSIGYGLRPTLIKEDADLIIAGVIQSGDRVQL